MAPPIAGYGADMNEADWLRKRWKHRFHGCVTIPATLLLGSAGLLLQHWWA